MSKKSIRINITSNLLERAGRAKKQYPCGATLRHGQCRIEVAFRGLENHYNIWDLKGSWLASFTDASWFERPIFEDLLTAKHANIRVVFEDLSPEANRALAEEALAPRSPSDDVIVIIPPSKRYMANLKPENN